MKLHLQFAIYSIALCMFTFKAKSQTNRIKPILFDGIVVAGYIDHGALINCTGPAIKYTHKSFSLMAGLLPSLKIKEDKAASNAPKNAIITPTLGFGPTAIYKHIALQVPLLYTSKTSTADGKWNIGIGMGYKF